MVILVASDTHGRRDRLAAAAARVRPDMVLFLGDGVRDLDALDDALSVRAVRGNCDLFGSGEIPECRVEEIGGVRLFLTHGHRYGVKYSLESAAAAAAQRGADVLLYGHTHVPFEKTLPAGSEVGGILLAKPLLMVCPGSLGDAEPSFATLTLRQGVPLAGFGKL